MIDTILLDLDGTLLNVHKEAFLGTYLSELKKVFARLGMDAELSIKAVLAGTQAMIANDGSAFNSQRFWEAFAEFLGINDEQRKDIEAACDSFYANEFDVVKSVVEPSDIPKRLVRALRPKGYTVVLATNPLFPACAVATRLSWAGLEAQDFSYATHYANSTFCKPNLGYYREIFAKIGKEPAQCLMAGNSLAEDMCAGALGASTFLVTDCIENKIKADIAAHQNGTLAELEEYLMELPDIVGGEDKRRA
ncbi:MAG: HAD family hydrolase [Dehalococcoidia bacterium]|nr:HAD family hydrolase [Dehalococcoidia bacterium]